MKAIAITITFIPPAAIIAGAVAAAAGEVLPDLKHDVSGGPLVTAMSFLGFLAVLTLEEIPPV